VKAVKNELFRSLNLRKIGQEGIFNAERIFCYEEFLEEKGR